MPSVSVVTGTLNACDESDTRPPPRHCLCHAWTSVDRTLAGQLRIMIHSVISKAGILKVLPVAAGIIALTRLPEAAFENPDNERA